MEGLKARRVAGATLQLSRDGPRADIAPARLQSHRRPAPRRLRTPQKRRPGPRGEPSRLSGGRLGGADEPGAVAAIRRRVEALGLADLSRVERIDWFSFQKNLVIELPGASARIVYIVAHYDKTGVNSLGLASSPNCVTQGVSDEALIDEVFEAADQLKAPLNKGALPPFAKTA
jgi:hypothetical protein